MGIRRLYPDQEIRFKRDVQSTSGGAVSLYTGGEVHTEKYFRREKQDGRIAVSFSDRPAEKVQVTNSVRLN